MRKCQRTNCRQCLFTSRGHLIVSTIRPIYYPKGLWSTTKNIRCNQTLLSKSQGKYYISRRGTGIFKIYAAVMQGDTLAPFLFVTVLDYTLRNAINRFEEELGLTLNKRQSRRVGVVSLCDLDFADYIVLVSDAVNHTQELLVEWRGNAKKWQRSWSHAQLKEDQSYVLS